MHMEAKSGEEGLSAPAGLSAQAGARADISLIPQGAMHYIFSFLGPRDLCVASAVCKGWRDLNRDTAANEVWQGHFSLRWRTPTHPETQGWQKQYGSKMRSARAMSSKGLLDVLYGHTAAVSGIALLPSCNLLATGSADSTVRLWDLQAGLPLAASRQLRGNVRALAMDESMLVCGGSQDGAIRLFRSRVSMGATRFDLAAPIRLSGHTGPVVSLALDSRSMYSASWDCTVRVWNRETLRRESLLAFPDWVHTVKPRGGHLLVTSGQVLHVHSLATGQCISRYQHSALEGNVHWDEAMSTAPLQVEGSRDGRTVFLAGSDGAIVTLDLRAPKQPAAVLWDQTSPVKDLQFEDPWLAAATYSGSVLLMDVETILKGGHAPDPITGRKAKRALQRKARAVRQRLTGPRGPALCVDIVDSYLACGAADPVVRMWDFQQPEREPSRPSTAPRQPRGSRRQRNRFPFVPDSDSSSDDAERANVNSSTPAGNIPLSQSLPAALGGGGFAGMQDFQKRIGRRSAQAPKGQCQDVCFERCIGQPEDEHSDSEGQSSHEEHQSSSVSSARSPSPVASQVQEVDCFQQQSRASRAGSGRFSVPVPLPVRCRADSGTPSSNSMETWQLWQLSREQGRLCKDQRARA